MNAPILGLHHVTAIASDPQRNLDFYTKTLGMRLVKLTVNFDDPGSYHFYFGDSAGNPGTILTFFPWPGAKRGRQGTRQASATAFAVPANALDYWRDRLEAHGVTIDEIGTRFGKAFLAFQDHDGMPLELVAWAGASTVSSKSGGSILPEYAIVGIYGVTLKLDATEPTARLLTEAMGYTAVGNDGERARYTAPGGGIGSVIDILCRPTGSRGSMGAGVVHHIAFRVSGDDQQAIWRRRIDELGFGVSPVMDREYFHSIYFREPGHVLFEIATDSPGFATDEAPDQLGTMLKLPAQYESRRSQIEQALPALRLTGDSTELPPA